MADEETVVEERPAEETGTETAAEETAAEETAAEEVADWRAQLKSEDAKKFAEGSTDVEHLVSRALEMRKQLSSAIIPPDKDAKPEEVAAFRKKIGVPATPEEYDFGLPKDQELSDVDKSFMARMATRMHEGNIPAEEAKALYAEYKAFSDEVLEQQLEGDRKFAEEAEQQLRKDWGADYDKNVEYSNTAARRMFGEELETARLLETKDGKLLLDHPIMVRGLAAYGREMVEGGLVPALSPDESAAVEETLRDLRGKIAAAQERGDSKEANRLYQEEQRLIAKTKGNAPIVGAT